ncbi:GMC oxidoreductase [Didymella exigua CBS 183.55]|uniref:GMC oxidoreductase n=1 Tax=Didymella exigua CBS 183.55 TaxID=1150837 RepID=A0A6A5RXT4_9PLEO|nr:GMC oxidoreductase [Didymella exigua CBS 183.55]KAF1932662.1 GMC oxidoreductase [Didymella exigua CBS 183.55]
MVQALLQLCSQARQGHTSLYQYSGICYGFLKWQTAASKSTRLLQLARSVADPSNVIDRMKLSLLSDPTSRAPDLQVVFGDGYIGTRGYPANITSGYVHISGANASAKPLIDPRYISNAFDLEATKEAAKYLRKMGTSSPFKELWAKEYDPGFDTQTDEQWEAYVRENVSTFYHLLETCAMPTKENGGVVDPELKVYGVRNLRVVDASVIPIMSSANIQTAVYGIAERAAEIIAKKYR